MSKLFFEVFPGLKPDKGLRSLFEETAVEKVTTDSARTRIKVRLCSSHLIHKRSILGMQSLMEKQLFADKGVKVFIVDRYTLSGQYTRARLFEEYRDSLSYEMEQYSPVLARIFDTASADFISEAALKLTLHDSCLAREKAEELENGLAGIFSGRFDMPTLIKIGYSADRKKERSGAAGAGAGSVQEEAAAVPESAAAEQAPDYIPEYIPDYIPEDLPFDMGPITAAPDQIPPAADTAAPAPAAPSDGSRRQDRRKRQENTDPDVIYGRTITGEHTSIADIIGEIGETVIHGRVMSTEARDIRGGKCILKFFLTDFEDSIGCKLFLKQEEKEEMMEAIARGAFLKVKGVPSYDSFDREIVMNHISGIMKIPSFVEKRKDLADEKRVELHCHTKMSDLDGVSECKDLVKRAYEWGMPAIAITDHGNVQAFPDALHERERLLSVYNAGRKEAGLEPSDGSDFFKVIYGVECYLVDDLKKTVAYSASAAGDPAASDGPEASVGSGRFVVFDLETTGLSPVSNSIIEFGAVLIENGEIRDRFSEFVNPCIPIPYEIQKLTGIDDSMVIDARKIDEVLPDFLRFCEGAVLVGHNVGFDIGFVREKARQLGLSADFTTVDTEGIARALLPGHSRYTLDAVAKILEVSLENHHRAVDDAEATAGIFLKEAERLLEKDVRTFADVEAFSRSNEEAVKRLHMYHCIILAASETGRVNLYRLISDSHLKYYFKKPRIPKSELMKHREGLLVGSACVMGELFQAVLENRGEETIAGIADFYDYFEIQPLDNNRFLLNEKNRSRYPDISSEEDLRELNRRIVRLGETMGKPVVATCDVHFLDPSDMIYRDIIQDGMGMSEEDPAPLYLRTTDEMLEEFSYLGAAKAKEVVVENTRKIAGMVDVISPVRPDKCPPVIPHSDETLREICYTKAHSMYGDPLPSIVEERLERELNSIISNGYSVMYIIAQKLVWKSVEDGYLVGSRGSVGSSFVATMAGITEVNPLSPHYYCPSCHFTDFDSPEVMAYRGKCGQDMPDRVCPVCGEPLKKDGIDIPFETFLGFKGNKEPDIDLNFSGEYQSKAHRYTEVIFGSGQTFKAGTIATVAEKTAFGYVKNYFERRNMEKRGCEIDRLKDGCVGIRRSTGQHPGGIVVLPLGEDINTFTPVQHPANDMKSDIITTHFDYHSIDHNLLKLDILGHDDPTMIRMLQDLTGIDPISIPLDDEKVMSLFSSTEALGITTEQNGGIDVGTLGVPEFGTRFVMGMLDDTRPSTMSELIRISGLSHGTDVWLGNAQDLIREGTATLSSAICTRDDIMTYLIQAGVEKSMSFSIMESVRKGKGLKPDMEKAMREAGVPDWYIGSCLKIKYMFPRAHAAAYVMMALRIAWFKVYYPLAYYAAYFSIRATAFSYELMCQGQDRLLALISEYTARKDSLKNKEIEALDDMYIVREMYARGYDFMPIDVMKAGARHFKIFDGRLMPALTSIENMGEKAAEAVEEAAKDGPFISRDDFRMRTKVPVSVIDKMNELGIFGELPESNQISLFDFL